MCISLHISTLNFSGLSTVHVKSTVPVDFLEWEGGHLQGNSLPIPQDIILQASVWGVAEVSYQNIYKTGSKVELEQWGSLQADISSRFGLPPDGTPPFIHTVPATPSLPLLLKWVLWEPALDLETLIPFMNSNQPTKKKHQHVMHYKTFQTSFHPL